MNTDQLKIIEEALMYYHGHCCNQATRKRGVQKMKPGQTMLASYKRQQERAQEQRDQWSKKADEVHDTLYAFDNEKSKLEDAETN